MNDNDKRISAIHVEDEGAVSAVWLSHCSLTDTITLYDCCIFKNELHPVIISGINARGRWIPVAWEKKAEPVADKYLESGLKMLKDPVEESPFLAQTLSLDIANRMRTGRFKVEKRLGEWLQEFKVFNEQGGKIPTGSFPLMAATRYAVAEIKNGKRLRAPTKHKSMAPKVAMI